MLNNISGYGTSETICDIPEVIFIDSSPKARYNNVLVFSLYYITFPINIKQIQYVNNTN